MYCGSDLDKLPKLKRFTNLFCGNFVPGSYQVFLHFGAHGPKIYMTYIKISLLLTMVILTSTVISPAIHDYNFSKFESESALQMTMKFNYRERLLCVGYCSLAAYDYHLSSIAVVAVYPCNWDINSYACFAGCLHLVLFSGTFQAKERDD